MRPSCRIRIGLQLRCSSGFGLRPTLITVAGAGRPNFFLLTHFPRLFRHSAYHEH